MKKQDVIPLDLCIDDNYSKRQNKSPYVIPGEVRNL